MAALNRADPAPSRPALSLFLTDGVLASLCDALSDVAGAPVTVHDPDGRRIVRRDGDPPWRIDSTDPRRDDVLAAIRAEPRAASTLHVEPILVNGEPIGALALDDPHVDGAAERHDIIRLLRLLSSTIGEFCENDLSLRRRSDELSVLYRLSSMLVEARDVQAILSVALSSAIAICAADAGTVHLLDDSRTRLTLRAHTGLSESFVNAMQVLPADAVADRESLAGSVRSVPNLFAEGRALKLDEIGREGLVAQISCGLVFKREAHGIIRLYFREERSPSDAERATLQAIVEQVAAAVAGARLLEAEQNARRVQRQLKLASDVQQRMLPRELPSIPRLDVGARYVPSFELGGDFYDLIDLGGNLGIIIGDVVGKGVPAALLMSAVRAAFRAHAIDLYHIDEVMSRVNRAMTRDTLESEFATVFFGVIDAASRRLTYCSAGHEPPFIARPGKRETQFIPLERGSMPIGIDESEAYQRHSIELAQGDMLVGVTDGVLEALNFDDEAFGRERFRRAVREQLASHAGAQQLADHIVWEVRRFAGLKQQSDDITVVTCSVG